MKPRPLIDATGTSVARIRPDSVKNSIAPERNWLSMSVSEPSWLFGKIWISTRPLVSCLIRSIASTARTLSGCATGELLAYLSWNSGAALAIQGIAIVALAAVPASSSERRVVLSVIAFPPIDRFGVRGTRGLAMALGSHHGQVPGEPASSRCVIKSRGYGPWRIRNIRHAVLAAQVMIGSESPPLGKARTVPASAAMSGLHDDTTKQSY